jgi:hypothetical protein
MTLASDQYTVINAELQRIHTYLVTLAAEIAVAPPTEQHAFTYQLTVNAAEQIELLRWMLTDVQAQQGISEQLHLRRWSGP